MDMVNLRDMDDYDQLEADSWGIKKPTLDNRISGS